MNAEISAAVIHDLKNSMALLEGRLELLARKLAAPADIVLLWQHSVQMRLRMVEFLTLYQYETASLPVVIEQHSVADFLENVRAMRTDIPGPSIRIAVASQAHIGCFDERIASLALLAALANARSFARTEVVLSARYEENCLVFSVADDGPGLGHGPTPGGTGLGLKVCEMAAHLHTAGSLRATCSLTSGGELGGALFELSLPQLTCNGIEQFAWEHAAPA